jgi:hypothetical protein
MDVSGRILRTWMPAIHAGMTALSICILCRRAQAYETLRGEITLLSTNLASCSSQGPSLEIPNPKHYCG